MRFKTILVCLAVLALATVARAQTKISGTLQCGKADQHSVEVGDQPNHSLGVSKVQCTWPKPIEMAGVQAKEGVSVASDEMTGNRSNAHGHHMGTMANGDTFHSTYWGFASLKDGAVQGAEGRWTFVGGTGKLNGIKGHGTYKGKSGADGSMIYEVEGDYTLPK